MLGTISDAQKEEVMALEELWPNVPHQTCQFHAEHSASRPGFKEDGQIQAEMRKKLQPKIRSVRKQIKEQVEQASEAEAEQLATLDEYAQGVQTALNLDGKLPFNYAGIATSEALDEVAASLDGMKKRGSWKSSCLRGN